MGPGLYASFANRASACPCDVWAPLWGREPEGGRAGLWILGGLTGAEPLSVAVRSCETYTPGSIECALARLTSEEIVGAAKRSIIPTSSGLPIATAGTQFFENHWIHSSRTRVTAAKMMGPTCRFAENLATFGMHNSESAVELWMIH